MLQGTKSVLQCFPPPFSIKRSLHSMVLALAAHSLSAFIPPTPLFTLCPSQTLQVSASLPLNLYLFHSPSLLGSPITLPDPLRRPVCPCTFHSIGEGTDQWGDARIKETLSSQCLWVEARGRVWLASWWSPGLAIFKAAAVFLPQCGKLLRLAVEMTKISAVVGAWKQHHSCRWFTSGGRERLEDRKQLSGKNFPVGGDIINQFSLLGGANSAGDSVTAVWEDESFHCGWWRMGGGRLAQLCGRRPGSCVWVLSRRSRQAGGRRWRWYEPQGAGWFIKLILRSFAT